VNVADKRVIKFAPETKWGKALQKWHTGLADNRGDRAALKQCKSPTQVVFVPAFHELYQAITTIGRATVEAKAITWPWPKLERHIRERLPIIASLTALVDPSENPDSGTETGERRVSLPRQMGTVRSSGGGPMVSDLRFRRLLKCRTPDELYPALRRVVGLLKNHNLRADVMSLAQSVFYWGENMRKEWAYEYYATESQQTE
jgi:CRISPR system Cascade subunit CasB